MLPPIMSYPNVRIVNEFPPFPENPFGLRRGSHIYSDDADMAEKFGFPVSQPFPLCYDGTLVRCNSIGWTIENLTKAIRGGKWKISDEEPVPEEHIPAMERRMGGQVTARDFWENLWDTQEILPQMFRLQAAPDVTAADMKAAARNAGKPLLILVELEPAQFESDTVVDVQVIAGDTGPMSLEFVQYITQYAAVNFPDMMSGDRQFICQLAH